jgi:hypothetical protein
MLEISKQEVLKKWGAMPINLREALCSEYSAETVKQICKLQHIPEEKMKMVFTNAGDVIFGFLHIEELAKEIQKDLGVNSEIANTIVAEIDRKIFRPIKADIEKNYYSPVPETEEEPTETAEPEMETKSPFVVEAPSVISQEKRPETQDRVVEIRRAEIPTAPVSPSPVPEPFSPVPAAPQEAAPEVVEEGPAIIHEETEFKPIAGIKKSLGGLFGMLNKKEKAEEASPVKAEIETGAPLETTSPIELPTPPLPPIDVKPEIESTEVPQTESTDIKEEMSKILSKTEMEMPKVKMEEIRTGIMNNELGIKDKEKDKKLEIKINGGQEKPKNGFFKKTFGGLTGLFGKKKEVQPTPEMPMEPVKRVDYSESKPTETVPPKPPTEEIKQ